jgi:hypothetical protein
MRILLRKLRNALVYLMLTAFVTLTLTEKNPIFHIENEEVIRRFETAQLSSSPPV